MRKIYTDVKEVVANIEALEGPFRNKLITTFEKREKELLREYFAGNIEMDKLVHEWSKVELNGKPNRDMALIKSLEDRLSFLKVMLDKVPFDLTDSDVFRMYETKEYPVEEWVPALGCALSLLVTHEKWKTQLNGNVKSIIEQVKELVANDEQAGKDGNFLVSESDDSSNVSEDEDFGGEEDEEEFDPLMEEDAA